MKVLNRSAFKTKHGLPFFEIPEMAKMEWLQHGFLTRKGGVSFPPYHSLNLSGENGDRQEHVFQNKNRVAEAFSFNSNQLISLNQVHQDKILLIKELLNPLPSFLEYDAIITNLPGIFISILTADCVPIFVVDKTKKVIAAIHAGRQGTALHITRKVLKKLRKEFGCLSEDLLVALGPSIGPCCYEIDEKVFQSEWAPFAIPKEKGKWMIDLSKINIDQIEKEGVKEESIYRIGLCTRCRNDLFFSHRKEGQTGRQLSFIGIL